MTIKAVSTVITSSSKNESFDDDVYLLTVSLKCKCFDKVIIMIGEYSQLSMGCEIHISLNLFFFSNQFRPNISEHI